MAKSSPNKNLKSQVVIQAIQKKAAKTIKAVEGIQKILTPEQYNQAAAQVKFLKSLANEAKLEKERFTKPLNQLLKVTREHFAPFETQVQTIEGRIKGMMLIYLAKQEKKDLALEAKVDSGKMSVASYTKAHAEIMESVTNGDSSIRSKQVLIIRDVKDIPRAYLMPDREKIIADLKEGKKVAGCYLQKEKQIAI